MSVLDNWLCKYFGIRCPEEPPEPELPESCIVCSETSILPNPTCVTVVEIFPFGESPKEVCDIDHKEEVEPAVRKVLRTVCVDSKLIRRKHCKVKERKRFDRGTEPTERCDLVDHAHRRTLTEYRMFENAKVMASVNPGDLHANVWKFHDNFTAENYVQVSESLARYKVNARRHFNHTGEGEGDLDPDLGYLVPYKRLGRHKFNLWELDPEDFWGLYGIFWRYQVDADRGIIPVVCAASGWKGWRYGFTAWHPKNNIGVKITTKDGVRKTIYMTSDHRKLLTDPDSGRIYRGVCEMLVDALRELKHPTGVIDPFQLEAVNEYDSKACGNKKMFEWHHALFSRLEKKKHLDPTRMAFEKWDSRWIGVKKLDDKLEPGLMDLFPGITCYYHGQTTFEQAVRWHKGEMGQIHDAYPGLCADSDGHEPDYKAKGIIGKEWGGGGSNINFRRISPVDLYKFMIYDYEHNGAGYSHLSGVQWFEDFIARYDSHVKAFVKGFTKVELLEYKQMVEDYRGIKFDIKWEDFSYPVKNSEGKVIGRKPLSEGKAIKRAMRKIHKE